MKCVKCIKSNLFGFQADTRTIVGHIWYDNGKNISKIDDNNNFNNLIGNDGYDITICLECGWIQELDLSKLKKDVIEYYKKDNKKETMNSNKDIVEENYIEDNYVYVSTGSSNSSTEDLSNSSSDDEPKKISKTLKITKKK